MPLTHEAFFYSSEGEFAARLVPFLREAVASDQGAIAVAAEPRIALLRRELGAHADAVSFFDARRWYRRPGTALVAWRDAVEQQLRDGSESVRAVGEIPYENGNGAAAIRNWARYESLVNRAFATRPLWIACAYNTKTVPEGILEEVRRTHPVASTRVERGASRPYFGGQELGAAVAPAEEPTQWREGTRVTFSGSHDVIDLRRAVRWEAQAAGLDADTVDDLLLALTELLRSSRSEGAAATIRTARQDGEWCCEITSNRSQADALTSGADELGLLIGRVISERVEIGEHADGSLVRFVFGTHVADPRRRIVNAASELFRANGVRTTGINAIIDHADVAKATFYAHFRSKDDLIRLWLRSPVVRWFDQVLAEVDARTQAPIEKLTTFFDVLGDWLTADDFHGCPFINTATEFRDAEHGFAQELLDAMREVEEFFHRTAADVDFADPDAVAQQLFLLVPGTITTAAARASAESARVAGVAAASLVNSAARG